MRKVTVLALSAMLSVPILAQTGPNGSSPAHAERESGDLFSYIITSPAEDAETFTNIMLQFPAAASVEYIPAFWDRPEYFSYKINGQKFNCNEYPSFGDADNEVLFGLGAEVSTSDRWELTIQPGLFRLLDAAENVLGENPLMEIVVTEGQPVSLVDFTFTTDPVSTDPYDESLKIAEVSTISLTFPNLDTVTADGNAVSVTLGGNDIDKSAYSVTTTGTDNVVKITFDPALKSEQDANLVITFPVGSLTGKKGDVSDTNKSDVVSKYYTLVQGVKHDLSIDFYSPKPDADGNLSVTKSLASTIFVCDTPDIKVGGGTDNHITLKEVNGDFESAGRLTVLTGMVSGKSTFIANFNQPVYNGKYTVTLSKGAIGDSRWRADHTMGHTNDDVVLQFNITGGEERPHIDLSVAYTAPETLAVKGIPSENGIYWYANIIEASRYPGDAEMFESAINFFKLGAETFGMNWVTVFQMTAKTGEYTWGFGDLHASTDYIVYAFGLDSKGDLYMPLTKIDVRTSDMAVSDNTFTLNVLPIENGTQADTKKVTIKVTPTNNDPYAVVILDKYLGDDYDMTEPTAVKNYTRNVLRPLVTDQHKYTGEQTVVFDNVKIDAVMQAAVFGYQNYETTDPTIADFSTVDNDFEAMTVEARNPTITGASGTFYSFDMVRPFIAGIISKATADAIGGIQNVHEEYRVPSWEAEGMGYYDWRYFANRDLNRQALDGSLSDILSISALKWDTEYYIYGYLMDEGGYRTSPVFYDTFVTKSRNTGTNTFKLKLNSITSNAPHSSSTFTADMTIVPADLEDGYALYYGETYDFEEYLDEGRIDDWMSDVFMRRKIKRTYTGELNFGYGSVYPDKTYILIVSGFDEAPNTEPTWMLFNSEGIVKDSWSGVSAVEAVEGDSLKIYAIGHDIRVEGEFTDAIVYTTDGMKAGRFDGNVCRVDGSGCYIVRVQTDKGVKSRKVFVK